MRYSEAFKLTVIRALEEGRYGSAQEAGRAFGVKGAGTVGYWVRRYGKDALMGKVVRVMKADEQSEAKGLRKRVRELEEALADAHLDLRLEGAFLKMACEAAGIADVEGFKKKHAGAR